MTLTRCPDCGREISNQAAVCPGCGRPLRQRGPAIAVDGAGRPLYLYEYKSRRTLFGLPLVHVMLGPVWLIGFKPACGIIAVGNIAVGFAAFGGVAIGLAAFGGISLGLVCFGGIAAALGLGAGGIATGYWALGGIAVGVYALGGLAIGAHTLQNDPDMLRMLHALFGRGST
ncbi:zinc ribbon domain-containing protein [Bradyrhizobium sp. LHD-71]|uniref:zinc ribbon domain-containing protein n=1 Tax=Bradyrhizobium sp. LHD-71 TaxID=3072141 RepID=UPI00280F40B2|nr:zinc ribbon domain-containing protein [Bradyrhizobium sp. LHD-71]MDQ8731885.1 zinc ribbon domain-containing protein [Bradyrhizobium sp. LHD-71]